ncbi:MAG: bifunctional folylpolyglutamate synthase/dihydrofolate synthase [Myxococcales bacterium]|nr:bifunctional folylpolyglutamate synthase/dihydrofolate synthase [Myxococcales bacterium]
MSGDLAKTLDRLYGLVPKGKALGLERMQAACDKLGNPERAFSAVHVAGTNGKGTVSAFVASIARASGKRVGLYTSPHLVRFAERIQIDGAPLDDDTLAAVLDRVMTEAPDLTFFETATLAAFLAFKEAKVDLAVLEVGLGGRLDATNVIPPPKVAVITRVAFDHMEELGDSLSKIATEKAGIIKKGTTVVVGKLHPDARDVIERRAAQVGAHLVALSSPEPIPGAALAYPRFAMFGSNLAVAVTVAQELGVAPRTIADGIEAAQWPGRNELLHRSGQELTLLDCAHNPDGTVALSHVLDPSILGEIESRRDVALIFGALKRKSWKAMLRRLDQVAAHKFFVAPPLPEDKVADPKAMAAAFTGTVAPSISEALSMARAKVGQSGLVVVTGSIYLVGAARALLLNVPADPPVDM